MRDKVSELGLDAYKIDIFSRVFDEGTVFYRARPLDQDLSIVEIKDCWEAPKEYVKAGRLNVAEEPLLYTAVEEMAVAIKEARVGHRGLFLLTKYKAKERIESVVIDKNDSGNPSLLFINECLKRDSTSGVSYADTEFIVKYYYDLPEETFSAWSYDSTLYSGGLNATFKPEAGRLKLEIEAFFIATLIEDRGYDIVKVGKFNSKGIMELISMEDGFPELVKGGG